MSDTFEKILVKDDRIGAITDKIKYAVLKGGMNVTSQTFPAISNNTSSLVFNCPVPSLETIVSREVLWESEFTFRINTANKPADQYAINYGVTDALAPFPAHSLLNTISATINNNTVTLNMAETLPILLRLIDPKDLSKYESMTPVTCDYLSSYKDGLKYCDYILDSDGGAAGSALPRLYYPYTGANVAELPGDATHNGNRARSYISNNNNVLSYDMNRTSGHGYSRGRGSWKLKECYIVVPKDDAHPNGKDNPLITSNEVYVTFRVCEPLLLSPFVFGSPNGKQGFYGIQAMNFNLSFLSTANRAWRSSVFNPGAAIPDLNPFTKSVTLAAVNESKLTFTFISPHASDLLAPRNIVPYYELPFFKTASSVGLPGKANRGQIVLGVTSQPSTTTMTSSNIQLSSIPDKLIIFARKVVQNLSCSDTDSYLTIKNVTVQFNNSVLMSSFTDKQLYRISVDSGLKNLSWDEFSGSTISVAGKIGGGTFLSEVRAPYTYVGANQTLVGGNTLNNVGFQEIPTTGSIVVLELGTHMQITEDYYAPSSLGSFNLNVKDQVENNHNQDWSSYELVVMVMN